MNTMLFWHALRAIRNPLHFVVLVCAMYVATWVSFFAESMPGTVGVLILIGLAIGLSVPGLSSVPDEAAYLLSRPGSRAFWLVSWMSVALVPLGLAYLVSAFLLGGPDSLGDGYIVAMDPATTAMLESAGFEREDLRERQAIAPDVHLYTRLDYQTPGRAVLALSILWGMLVRFGTAGSIAAFSPRRKVGRYVVSGAAALVAIIGWVMLVFFGRATHAGTWLYLNPQYLFSALGVGITLTACQCALVWFRGDTV